MLAMALLPALRLVSGLSSSQLPLLASLIESVRQEMALHPPCMLCSSAQVNPAPIAVALHLSCQM